MMRRYVLRLLLIVFATGAVSCSSNSAWDELPSAISQFVSRYFPEEGVSDYGKTGDVYHVKIRNGAGLSFNREYQWITVNGYGSTLPEMFLFDQLPPALYEHIQGLDQLGDVYSVSRDATTYCVSLTDSTVTYNIRTGVISGA